MKLDLLEIGNIPYRNRVAREYSNKILRNRRRKSAIVSVIIGMIIGLYFGFCHIQAVAGEQPDEIRQPKAVEMTYYTATGNDCANGKPPHTGIVAYSPEYIGDTAILYENDCGKVGQLIGIYEIYDTGYGKTLPSGFGSIQEGKTVDVFMDSDEAGREFIKEHGNEIFIQVVRANG